MIKLTERTLNIIDLLIRHSFHYWIWTFCALFLIFDKVLHMPLEFLSHFNYIPEFIINLSKIINTKPIEATFPEINVIPTNNDELILVIKESISLLQQEMSTLNNKIDKLTTLIQDNNLLLQNQMNYQKELFNMVNQKLSNFAIANDTLKIDVSKHLQDIIKVIRLQANGQFEIANKIILNINENKGLLTTLNNSVLTLYNTLSNIDINKPILNIQDILTQVLNNQKELETLVQSFQDINIQGFNTILEVHTVNVESSHINMDKLFSKVNEVRNHNLELYRQLDKNIDFKFENTESRIVNQITEEINRPKTFNTEANKHNSWSKFFDKKS